MDFKILTALIAFFIFGLLAGSFLNIVIYKIPRKLHLFKPYSICHSCKQETSIPYSFPIIALLTGRHRCKKCASSISLQSIFIEFLNALLYVLIFLTFGFSGDISTRIINTIAGLILVSVLLVVSFIDWEFMIIPNIIVLPFTLAGLILNIILHPLKWWMPLAFSAGAFIFMLIIHLVYPKGMGMGDVKLALMLGAFLVKNVIVGIFMGFLIGSITGIIFLILKKKTLKQVIPFGPFISAGGLIAFFFGDYISRWYTGFF